VEYGYGNLWLRELWFFEEIIRVGWSEKEKLSLCGGVDELFLTKIFLFTSLQESADHSSKRSIIYTCSKQNDH